VIRQARERKIFGGTGALVGRVLLGSTIVPYGDRSTPCDLGALADPAADFHVLFPIHGAPVVSPALLERPGGRALGLVVLDATWSQARKMAQRIPELRGLPRVQLPEDAASRFAVREAPGRGRIGTAEAVAFALGLLGEWEAAEALGTALARVAEHVLRTRGKLPSRKKRR
jgi:DTW domain-containing protein YfiP